MVGYTVNTGTSEEFAAGWDRVFGGDKKPVTKKKPAKKKSAKAKPVAGKKSGQSKAKKKAGK